MFLSFVARNAIFITVTFMDSESGEIIVSRTYDRRMHGLSAQAMEPYVTKELLDLLKSESITIDTIGHDDNKAVSRHVAAHVNPDGSKPKDQLDCWHYVRLLLRKVTEFLAQRSALPSRKYLTVCDLSAAGIKHVSDSLSFDSNSRTDLLKREIDATLRAALFYDGTVHVLGLPGRGM